MRDRSGERIFRPNIEQPPLAPFGTALRLRRDISKTTIMTQHRKGQKRPAITVTAEDHRVLGQLATASAKARPELAAELAEELDRAKILPAGRISAEHARIGSAIRFRDETTGRESTVTLVLPQDADIEKSRISIMTPVGVALIGMAPERSIDWVTPAGEERRLTVLDVTDPAEEPAAS